MNVRLAAGLAIALTVLAATAAAQDAAAAKDHPLVKPYAGSTIIDYEAKNFDSLLIPTGRVATDGKARFVKPVEVEGRITRIRYKAPAGRTSLEVFRNYESALKAAGFQILFSCIKTQCGDGDVFVQTLYGTLAVPLTLNQKSQAYLSARLQRAAGDVYVRLLSIENHSWSREAKTEEGQVVTQLDIAETTAMEGGLVTVDAAGMRKAIQESGRVALYGIYFDSGKATVKPESKSALDEIAKLLKSDRSLRLLVVGHTDTDGPLSANLTLSQARAAAVVHQLTSAYSIPSSRLAAMGVGFAAPVATNRTSEGKTKNRRVELVEY